MKIKLERYGKSGWEFQLNGEEKYRTDIYGDGLWRWNSTGSWFMDGTLEFDWKQVNGTCQFSLPANRSSAYNKIYRHFIQG